MKKDPRFAVVVNHPNIEARVAADRFMAEIPGAREVYLVPGGAWRPGKQSPTEAIVVFGGDGTFLNTVQQAWRYDIPFLGMAYGEVGALSNEPAWLVPEKLLRSEYMVLSLPLLRFDAMDHSGRSFEGVALNDVALRSDTTKPGACRLRVRVDEEDFIPHLVGDGFLVATPIGSTAYNFTTQGPVVDPTLDVICAGVINARVPYRHSVHPSETVIAIDAARTQAQPIILSFDGSVRVGIASVRIWMENDAIRLVMLRPVTFMQRLHRLSEKYA